MSNVYNGPFALISHCGPAEVPDALVNLTPHPIIVAGLPGGRANETLWSHDAVEQQRTVAEIDSRASTVLARARELGMTTEGYVLVAPSHGSIRLVERPVTADIPLVRSGTADRLDCICGRVPDCISPFDIPEVSFGEVTGDLPPALPRETVTDTWGRPGEPPRFDASGYVQPHEPYTFTMPGHYQTPGGNRVWFLVSLLTAMALRGRHDVLTIGPEIRDATGRILGCLRLRRVV